MRVAVADYAGDFAGDKDAAATIRDSFVRPALKRGDTVILDFSGVELATQSFVHALVAALVRSNPQVLDDLVFEHCNDSVQSLVEIVVDYAQEEL